MTNEIEEFLKSLQDWYDGDGEQWSYIEDFEEDFEEEKQDLDF